MSGCKSLRCFLRSGRGAGMRGEGGFTGMFPLPQEERGPFVQRSLLTHTQQRTNKYPHSRYRPHGAQWSLADKCIRTTYRITRRLLSL